MTGGTPFGVAGSTNSMLVESIGDVLVRGEKGYGSRVYGNVAIVMAPHTRTAASVRDRILVIAECNESYEPLVKEASGIVLQNLFQDTKSEDYLFDLARGLDKPIILRGDGACTVLKEGQIVTLDPSKALIYKGLSLDK